MSRLSAIGQRIDKFFLYQFGIPSTIRAGSFRTSRAKLPFGVNVAGYLMGEFGVAEAVRALIRALQATDVPYTLNNIVVPWHRNLDKSFEDFSETNPYRVNLIHVNADQAHEFYKQKGWKYFQSRYNIGIWFWELSHFPEEWLSSFRYYQEIWVASQFCAESLAKVSPIPVVKITYPIYLDDSKIQRDRVRFDLQEGSFVFLFVFDFRSVFERKNPLAVVEAFKKAFSNEKNVVLVLKSINSEYNPQNMVCIQQAITGLNVKIIDAHLNSEDFHSLIATSDCYVSLHRSEGLGLTMAQSMYLKKPVIATAYSGNMVFMNVDNSFLIKYKLVELDKDYGPYKKGNVWADPDIAHAAELMRVVYEDRELGAKIGQRASEDIRSRMNPTVAGQEIQARLLRVAGD